MVELADCIAAERETFGFRSPFERLSIMMYELGAVSKAVVHGLGEPDPYLTRARMADALVELSDLLTQLDMLRVELLDEVTAPTRFLYRNLGSMAEAGRERQVERMKEWEERQTDYWRGAHERKSATVD